jgi:predicted DNA-binding transcriptional regulator AlpA
VEKFDMARRLIGIDDLPQKGIRYSKSQLWRKVKAKTFPQPVAGAGKSSAFVEDEIDAYIEQLIAERDSVAA